MLEIRRSGNGLILLSFRYFSVFYRLLHKLYKIQIFIFLFFILFCKTDILYWELNDLHYYTTWSTFFEESQFFQV